MDERHVTELRPSGVEILIWLQLVPPSVESKASPEIAPLVGTGWIAPPTETQKVLTQETA
jgi:hypothetical protein